MLKLYYKRHKYDYIILDRTHFDTKIFTSNNINDEKKLSILENIFENNIFKSCELFDYTFF
jgi:hypothetical protein